MTVPLTTTARCHDTTCGWAAEGDPKTVDRASNQHVKAFGHGVSVTTSNPEAPVRTGTGS